jgi:hypothetical protein
MATNTYVALDKVTVTSSVTSVTLNMGSTLSQAYTDLVLVANTIVPTGNTFPECSLRFNGDTGSNYSSTYLLGLGSGSGVSGRASNITYADCGYLTSNSGNPNTRIINIMNYSNTTTNKTVISRGSSDNGGQVIAYANLWRNTAAITSITVFTQGGTYAAGSTFSLYGIAAASVGAKATGGTIYSDDLYYYHVFGSTGTFTPLSSLTADVLVVAGGGAGGGNYGGGGGGAGGLLAFTSQSLTATGYTCTVGGGGTGSTNPNATGGLGGDSQFGALTLVKGGGGGGAYASTTGANGGSGGGGTNNGSGGSATSGQGFAGGTGSQAAGGYPNGAGGGGSSAVGTASSGSTSGSGGNGLSTYSSWGLATGIGQNVSGTVYFAGGGAGNVDTRASSKVYGTAGLGGGGSTTTTAGGNGVSNTGGGGAGASDTSTGGSGGSGVVIIRYLKA